MGRNPKRKISRGRGSGALEAKRPRQQWNTSPFGQAVETAGILLFGGQQANETNVEPAIFQRQLSTAFRRHMDLDQAAEQFCEGLLEYIDDPVRFRMCLLPTRAAEGADVIARSSGLDSLMRLLLGVECIQSQVANILLEKLPEYMDDSGNVDTLGTMEYHQMPQLILNQLRWLDQIVKGKELCAKLLEVVGIAPLEVQREIVTAIPEILDDAQHNDAAGELKSLLQTNSDLTSAIIDALSSLNVTTELEAEVLDVALSRVASADLSDLPTVIKFVMQQVTPKNALEIISELRESLDFDSTFIPAPGASSTPRATQNYSDRMSARTSDQTIVFDTIRSSICFQKAVADGWMKAIESVTDETNHKVIDIFVLFILHSIGSRKKAVESLFCSKVKAGNFSEVLMSSAFGAHTAVLREFFPSVLSLCETLLCSSSASVSTFAVSLYQHVFTTFDVYCQQEVISALITHIGGGMPTEVDHALDTLEVLVERQRTSMQRFAIFVKGILDYLEHLSMSQIRKLYFILSVLAFQDPEEASSVQDEMHTVIRKQLSHVDAKYRRMGVVGAVMVIQQLGRHSDEEDMTVAASQANPGGSTLTQARWRLATAMLDDVICSCSRSPDLSILFYDEMSSVVVRGTLDSSLLRHLCEEMTSKFQDVYLVESTDSASEDHGLPVELAYGLDSTDEGSVALNLLPMVMSQVDRGQERGALLRGLAAQFRLLRVCEHTLNGNLEGVDALLGSPVVMCTKEKLKSSTFEDLPLTKRQDVCLSIFHCLNWFRELVCAFAGETDPDMKGKVIIRLKDIIELQALMESCMAATPGFLPPNVNCDEVVPPTSRGRKGKSKGDATLASVTCATQNLDKNSTAMDKTSATPSSSVPIDLLRPYFREMDLGVFSVLHYGPLSRTLVNSENQTEDQEEVVLRPPELSLLLRDLHLKLTSTLSAFGTKGLARKVSSGSDGVGSCNSYQLVATMTTLVSALCEHMERTSAYFQAQLAESDGMIDVESSHEDYPILCTCFNLLFRNMATFFAWRPLSDPHHEEHLLSSMKAIAARISSSQLDRGLPNTSEAACKYLVRFSEFLPTLTCAHSLARLLVALCRTCRAEHLHQMIASECGNLLKRPWRAAETGQQRNDALEYLLKYHVTWSKDPLQLMEEITGDNVVELMGEEAREQSATYSTLTKTTVTCYYRCMMTALVSQVKGIPAPSKSTTPTLEILTERFHVLELSAKILFILMNLVKSFDRRSVLSSALKNGRLYIEAFLKHGMPVLDGLFRTRKDDVIALLKTLQQSTRCLHHFCTHSKVAKDVTLINHVPQLKRGLETLVFKVKEVLTNHNCREAFWMGNLKNRDLKGQELLSQVSSQASNNSTQNGEDESDGEGTNSTSTDRRGTDDEIPISDDDEG